MEWRVHSVSPARARAWRATQFSATANRFFSNDVLSSSCPFHKIVSLAPPTLPLWGSSRDLNLPFWECGSFELIARERERSGDSLKLRVLSVKKRNFDDEKIIFLRNNKNTGREIILSLLKRESIFSKLNWNWRSDNKYETLNINILFCNNHWVKISKFFLNDGNLCCYQLINCKILNII